MHIQWTLGITDQRIPVIYEINVGAFVEILSRSKERLDAVLWKGIVELNYHLNYS